MKVMIDIPDDHKRVIDNLVEDGKGYLLPYEVENQMALAIRNGKVLSDMTNGEVIKAMFNDFESALLLQVISKDWWNAPYKKGAEE